MDRLWPVLVWVTWIAYDNDIKHIHRGYNLDLKSDASILLHNLLSTFLLVGTFFASKADILLHMIVAYTVVLFRVINGDCVLSIWQKKWIGYSEEDTQRIHGDLESGERTLYFQIVPMLILDMVRYRFIN